MKKKKTKTQTNKEDCYTLISYSSLTDLWIYIQKKKYVS